LHLWLLWQPDKQAVLHTRSLLERVSDRDWPAVSAMMTEDFQDGWGHGREEAVDGARTLLSHFFALHIVALEEPVVEHVEDRAKVAVRIGIFGSGTAVAEAVMEEVRSTEELTVFQWRKAGPWPWDWKLSGVRNARLETFRAGY
jgi:hypothetical protein